MLLFPLANCMSLTILYEKKVEKTVEQTYRIYLEQLIKSINTITAKKNINFDIDKIQSYSTYVNQEEYADLSGYAGEGNIKKRMEILDKMKVENYIFAVTTNLYDEMEEYQIVTPCKINYIFNLDSQENYDNDLLSNLQYALREALSHVIKYDGIILNLLNTQDKLAHEVLEKHVDKLDTDMLFASCNKNESMKQDDEDVSLDRLEALLSKLQNKPEKREQKSNDGKEKKDEVKGESGLIIKSLQQLQKKIGQVDARIREVETGTTDMKPKNKRSRLRHAGMYESENVTPITLTNHDTTNYHPFNFKKKDLKKQENNDTKQ